MTDDRRVERTHFHTSDAVRASISADGLVLLDVQGGVVLASNSIGARIWQLVESGLDGLEIASRLACDYDVSIERAQHDVAAFLTALEARGLVSAEPAC
jgi:Coenzyme PQQ synthesis protein D (PqqD)